MRGVSCKEEREKESTSKYTYIYIYISQTAISCFFNKRKRNVIVLFVSTFKNTTLPSNTRVVVWRYEEEEEEEEGGGGGGGMRGSFELRRGREGGRRGGEWREYLRRY